jgi:hypothetical protein
MPRSCRPGSMPDALGPGFHCATTPPDTLDPGFYGARTQWIRDFMAFQLARRTRTVMLMAPVCLAVRLQDRTARPRRVS